MLIIVGLGAEQGDLSVAALKALKDADEVIVRTSNLSQARTLDKEGISYTHFDALYERSRNYDTLTKHIVRELKQRSKGKTVAYCVDGSVLEDSAARALLGRKGVTYLDGPSKASRLAAKAELKGGYTAVSAFELAERRLALPLVIYDLTADNAGDVKLLLAEKYGDEAPVCFIADKARRMPLYEIDRQKAYGGVVVYDIPLLEKKRFEFEDVVAVLKRLRAPDGCPWDKVQTHESIRINAIEEAYELVDAIDLKAPEKMREEAGDVIMQAVFHSLIEEDAGNFTVVDVLTELCEKLITRHTHVFGTDKASSADGALSVWEKNKMTEKHQTTYSDAVNDVPECFPALLRAQKIAKRVEKGGWDAATIGNFEKKIREEYEELMTAYGAGKKEEIAAELGDVIFCVVELARAVGADAEMALLDTVKKMQKRYTEYEKLVLADGKDPIKLTQGEKDCYYERAKRNTRA